MGGFIEDHSSVNDRVQSMELEARNGGPLWSPLLPEQITSVKRHSSLRYFIDLANGLNPSDIAKRDSYSEKTVQNAIGLGARILGVSSGADSSRIAIAHLIHAGVIPLDQLPKPSEKYQERVKSIVVSPRQHLILKLCAAGATNEQIRQLLGGITPKAFSDELWRMRTGYTGREDNDAAEDSPTIEALLVTYLQLYGAGPLHDFLPTKTVETNQSYEFSPQRVISDQDLLEVYQRKRPVYEFLRQFSLAQVAELCVNLTTAQRNLLESYLQTGSIQAAASLPEFAISAQTAYAELGSAQAILGTTSPQEAALLYLIYIRDLPSPDQFGLSSLQLSAYWYLGRNIDYETIATRLGISVSALHSRWKLGNRNLGVDSAQKALMKLVERYPIEDFIGEIDLEQLKGYIAEIAEYERETLKLFCNPNRPYQREISTLSRGTISSRLVKLSKRLGLPIITVLFIYKWAEQQNLLQLIEPKPRRSTIQPKELE